MAFGPRTLGRTGLCVGPLGLGASFGVGGDDIVWAVDHGVSYLYWGTLRRAVFGAGLREALRARRDAVALVIQSYARLGAQLRWSLESALGRLRADHAEVLLLGWWQGAVWGNVMEEALRLRDAGKTRFLGVSTHNRPLAGERVADAAGPIDVVHVRYNAAHRGAEREIFPHRAPAGPALVAFTATRWASLLRPQPGFARTPTAGDCYRFVLTNPDVDVCLAGPRDGADLRAAVAALARGPMDEDELSWMRCFGDRVYAKALRRG